MSKLAQEFRAISAKKNTGVTAETSTGFSFNFLEEYDKDTSRETDSLIDTNSREIGDNVANQSAAGRSKKTKKKKKKNSTQDSGTPAIASTEEPTTIVDEKCVADMAHMNIKDSNIETSKQSTTHAEVEQVKMLSFPYHITIMLIRYVACRSQRPYPRIKRKAEVPKKRRKNKRNKQRLLSTPHHMKPGNGNCSLRALPLEWST